MSSAEEMHSHCMNLCLARHFARVYGENEARAITRTARRIRDTTKDPKLYELAKMYSNEIAAATVEGKRLTGDELKIMSVDKLHKGMIAEGVL